MITIDTTGDVCPVPVIKTKKAMEQPGVQDLMVVVDNEISMNNVKKMAVSLGAEVTIEKISDTRIELTIQNRQKQMEEKKCEEVQEEKKGRTSKVVVAISSKEMGSGEEELGHILMKGFIFALSQLEELPQTILFYNGGANLTTNDSECIEDLRIMEQQGVEILTCGTCLDFYGKKDQLGVGNVTNMYNIVEILTKADKVVRP